MPPRSNRRQQWPAKTGLLLWSQLGEGWAFVEHLQSQGRTCERLPQIFMAPCADLTKLVWTPYVAEAVPRRAWALRSWSVSQGCLA